MHPSTRLDSIEISLIRQINALATPLSINLGIGEPNVEPDERFREIAAEAARTASWHYSANAGTIGLRERIAASLESAVDPKSEICVTAGTEEALYAIAQAFISPGDEVLVPDPGFLSYPTLVRLAGGTPVHYTLEAPAWRVDFSSLESKLSDRTRMIVINSPSNPTGGVLTRAELDRVAELAESRGILVISDEVYREIHYEARPESMLGRTKNAVIVSGMSKSHAMTGLRLGWAIADAPLMTHILKAHQYIATCASVLSQAIAERVFDDSSWNAAWLAKIRAQFSEQRDVALQSIEHALEVPLEPPGGAFYAFAPVPSCDTESLARALATEAAVLAIPGVAFGARGEGFLRISYAASPDNIRRGIDAIGHYLKSIAR